MGIVNTHTVDGVMVEDIRLTIDESLAIRSALNRENDRFEEFLKMHGDKDGFWQRRIDSNRSAYNAMYDYEEN